MVEKHTYEQLREGDFLPAAEREAWARLDRRGELLTERAASIIRDPDTTPEAKRRLAQELYDEEGPKIVAEGKALRERLLKLSKSAENSSIPVPAGESLRPEDPSKVLIGQNEAARIIRRIERSLERSKDDRGRGRGPFVASTSDVLKEEYEKAMGMAGTRGGAIARGALMAAEELGAGTDWLPRQERHVESLDRARRLLHASDAISTRAPVLPKSLQTGNGPKGGPKLPVRRRAGGPLLVPRGLSRRPSEAP